MTSIPEIVVYHKLLPLAKFQLTTGSSDSVSWKSKFLFIVLQAANAISTLAMKIGSSLDNENLNMLIDIILSNLEGRIWDGKENLLKALASICSNCK